MQEDAFERFLKYNNYDLQKLRGAIREIPLIHKKNKEAVVEEIQKILLICDTNGFGYFGFFFRYFWFNEMNDLCLYTGNNLLGETEEDYQCFLKHDYLTFNNIDYCNKRINNYTFLLTKKPIHGGLK